MPSGDPSGDPGAGVSVGSTAAAENLGGRVLRGVGWVIGGQFAMQAWRLASNLVLTRLVAPEAFGLMGLVQVFLFSAQLLSDVGLRGSVIYHARGDRREFLDTVWTVAVLRGVVLWGVVCAGAYPFARF